MDSGRLGSDRLRLDQTRPTYPSLVPQTSMPLNAGNEPLDVAIQRTTDWLLDQQASDGYWVGELEGDTILESEFILLLAYLDQAQSDVARRCSEYILQQQSDDGGWAIYPGGPIEVSASVKAYFALKLTGHSPQSDYMQRARHAILQAGGAEKINSFTRYYLALLGVIRYGQCPAVPPELMLIPKWMPFNIYEMSAWSRTILVPLSLLWAYQPVRRVPEEMSIRELFVNSPEQLPTVMGKSETLDEMSRQTRVNWDNFFRVVDRGLKIIDKLRLTPLRGIAIGKAKRWMLERFEESDGLGAIFPPIIWSVVALKCLGYPEDSPEITSQMRELEKLTITEDATTRLQPCQSPVWDTCIATIALREANIPWNDPHIQKSVQWMLSKEVRTHGDWAALNKGQTAAGWFFEFNNRFYPDIDDTIMVLMALNRCLPGNAEHSWTADILFDNWSPHEADLDTAAVVTGRSHSPVEAFQNVENCKPVLMSMWRGIRWVMGMQCRNGGWAAFDVDNDRELFTRVPFADHNAMIDPPTADITARVLEMLGCLKVPLHHPSIQRALDFVWNDQQADGSWIGRWGVNYIYGTWQALVGLTNAGVPRDDARLQRAADWLKSVQQKSGGWGETPRSYDEPQLRGQGPVTPSQTAWALMGLIAAGETRSDAARRGAEYLVKTQSVDGTWDEPWFTGTGFPRVFYLKYHYYRIYFPLMALARYRKNLAT